MTILNYIGSFAAIQSVLFFLFLINSKKGKRLSNLLLASFVLALVLHFIFLYLVTNEPYGIIFPSIHSFVASLYLPILFFYVQSLIYQKSPFQVDKWHLHIWLNLPLFLFLIFWIFDDYRRKLLGLEINNQATIPILIQMVLYIILIHLNLRQAKKVAKNTRSDNLPSQVSLISMMINVFSIFILLVMVEYFTNLHPKLHSTLVICIFLSLLILINSLVYYGLKDPSLFRGFTDQEKQIMRKLNGDERLNVEISNADMKKVSEFVDLEKPYMNPDINLDLFANDIGMSPYHLSLVLNKGFGENFYEYINRHRIQEAQVMIKNQPLLRIKEVMYAVGFTSKSSFNSFFKKFAGMTPSEYKRSP